MNQSNSRKNIWKAIMYLLLYIIIQMLVQLGFVAAFGAARGMDIISNNILSITILSNFVTIAMLGICKCAAILK